MKIENLSLENLWRMQTNYKKLLELNYCIENLENLLMVEKALLIKEDDGGGGGVAGANAGNVGGMGAVVSAQPGSIPGTFGTTGSGDIGNPLFGTSVSQYVRKPTMKSLMKKAKKGKSSGKLMSFSQFAKNKKD